MEVSAGELVARADSRKIPDASEEVPDATARSTSCGVAALQFATRAHPNVDLVSVDRTID